MVSVGQTGWTINTHENTDRRREELAQARRTKVSCVSSSARVRHGSRLWAGKEHPDPLEARRAKMVEPARRVVVGASSP